MDGRNVFFISLRLTAAACVIASLSCQAIAQDDKFAKVDALLKSTGMTHGSPGQGDPSVASAAPASAQANPQVSNENVRVDLPTDQTVREEMFKDGLPTANFPDKSLMPPVEQANTRASTSEQPRSETAARTVVMWGSGSGSSANQQSQSGFVHSPGLEVNQRENLNQPDVLSVPFVEIPAGSVFEFVEDVAIPASKDGVLFSEGVMTSAIEQRQPNGILQLMADRSLSSAAPQIEDCALLSDRSNLLMKGSAKHPVKTFLEIDRLELVKQLPSERHDLTPIIAKVLFKTKQSKNANDAPVNISLICTLPKEYWASPKQYKLSDLSVSVGHIFLFKLARVAEI